MKKFFGTGVALITPFKKDLSIDVDALEKLVNFQVDNGVDYLVVLGTTAESATLSKSEKELVKETIIKANNKRLPLVIGIGGNNTLDVVAEIKNTDLSNFDAILSVSPYYNKPTQEGIYQHFKAIATATNKDIILYNVPGRTAKNMDPSIVLRLANEYKNIIGIKEAAGDMVQALKIIQHKPKDFLVISGDDMITLPMVLAGGAGVISVIAQGLPREFSKMMNLGLKRNVDEAFDIQYQIMESIDLIFEEGNPAGIKAMLAILGICNNTVRLPLVPATNELNEKIKNFINQLNS
ncbi:MAG TPA: 4-hydroxy-tetrahydrodipicolinate synthase [Flavobacteriaceae bacterium]|nr:4-hydroxy-tetrahydrodipicolinate synthase [Flavobacteriaceae bacterium]HEX5742612.1 4-hydroxy-tetrahydrodipicolinate synthase [Flavobacteriaceae bacterium]